jgi:cysteine synthase A
VSLVAAWAARVHPGAVVATVFPDGPHRYLGSVYDDDFAAAHGLDPAGAATRPVEIPHPGAVEATGWVRCRTVRDPLDTPTEENPCEGQPAHRTPAPDRAAAHLTLHDGRP